MTRTEYRPPPPAPLWRERNFLLLWLGQGAGTLGPRVALVAVPLLALTVLHASTFQVSLLTFLGWLPYLVFSLPAGVLADRFDQRRIMIGCDLARMVLLLSVPVAGLVGTLTLAHLYAVTGATGVLSVLFTVAYRGQLPKLVAGTHLVDANGKLGMCESLAELVGPALGGVLVGLVGAVRSLFTTAGTYALSALALLLMRVPESAGGDATGSTRVGFRAAMGEGLGFVRRDVILRRLLAYTCVSNFFVMAATAIEVTFLVRELGASAATVGAVFSVSAVGGLLASGFARRITARFGTARVTWLPKLLSGPLYLLMPLATPGWGVALFAVGLTVHAANGNLFNVASISYRQAVCPPGLQSRVSAVYLWFSFGVIPFGSLLGGVLGSAVGLRPTLWVCAVGMWSAALFVVFSPLRRVRDIPVPEPAVAATS